MLTEELPLCNATFPGFLGKIPNLQTYTNLNIQNSFDYLLLSTHFASYKVNRPGFAKQFRELSNNAWNHAIGLIKHITKRGGAHDFQKTSITTAIHNNNIETTTTRTPIKPRTFEQTEIGALAMALDMEKTLAFEAHELHRTFSHVKHEHYEPEVS